MPADDKPTAALRALLTGELDRHKEIIRTLDNAETHAYLDLVAASFVGIADMTFGTERDAAAAVAEWVGKARSESRFPAEAFNPVISEQVILVALGKDEGDDLSARQLQDGQLLLLPALVHDQDLAADDIEDFLSASWSLLIDDPG